MVQPVSPSTPDNSYLENLFKQYGIPYDPSLSQGALPSGGFDEPAATAKSGKEDPLDSLFGGGTMGGIWEMLKKASEAVDKAMADWNKSLGQNGTTGSDTNSDFEALSDSQAFWDHNPGVKGDRQKFDRTYLQAVADNKDNKYDEATVTAAKNILASKGTSDYLDNADKHGIRDGIYPAVRGKHRLFRACHYPYRMNGRNSSWSKQL